MEIKAVESRPLDSFCMIHYIYIENIHAQPLTRLI